MTGVKGDSVSGKTEYSVTVECRNEEEFDRLVDRLTEEGWTVRKAKASYSGWSLFWWRSTRAKVECVLVPAKADTD